MNSNDKQMIDRAVKQARPTEITVQSVSSVGGTNAVREAIKEIEASVSRYQKSGSEVLLIAVKR